MASAPAQFPCIHLCQLANSPGFAPSQAWAACVGSKLETGKRVDAYRPDGRSIRLLALSASSGRFILINNISIIAPRGNTIHVTAVGKGEPLVLLHGFPLDSRMWTRQIESLSQKYRLLCVDCRGFGKSTTLEDTFSLSDLAVDVECVRDHLANGQSIHLCGLSMGAYVAFEYWQQFRQNLRTLALCCTKPHADLPEAKQARMELSKKAASEGTWAAVAAMVPKLLANSNSDAASELKETVQQMMRECMPSSISAAQTAMAERKDFFDSLGTIKIPTLVVAGELDTIAPPADSLAWSKHITGSSFASIKGAAHLPPIEKPSEFNTVLEEFLASH